MSGRPRELASDCTRCVGLCCVALPFRRSADFPVDKAAGEPCRNLLADHACGIHDRLRGEGWVGCTVYECFGAGQTVTAAFPAGWRDDPATAAAMFAAFPVAQQAHEVLRHLAEVIDRTDDDALRARARDLAAELGDAVDAMLVGGAGRAATGGSRDGPSPDRPSSEVAASEVAALDVASLDVAAWRTRVGPLLSDASAGVRAALADGPEVSPRPVRPSRGRRSRRARPGPRADLVGADLRGADLRGVDLRGALLLGSDLREADLRGADLLGADLRAADLAGADLREALFLTQPQVDAARGDRSTLLGTALRPPRHWG